MNWHLFLDVVAWMGAVIFTLMAVFLILGSAVEIDTYGEVKNRDRTISAYCKTCLCAILCWAWIIAG